MWGYTSVTKDRNESLVKMGVVNLVGKEIRDELRISTNDSVEKLFPIICPHETFLRHNGFLQLHIQVERSINCNESFFSKEIVIGDELTFTSNIRSIDCGEWHLAALTEAGEVYTWGSGTYGLGHNSIMNADSPLQVQLPHPVIQLACGKRHSGVVTTEGELFLWGDNSSGQIGCGDMEFTHFDQYSINEEKEISTHRRRSRAILPARVYLYRGTKVI